jgi:hypothetical protein
MAQRLELHEKLVEILGSRNVYFQPPPSVQLEYPCIIYQRSDEDAKFADNGPYARKRRYTVTYVDLDADAGAKDQIASLPMCIFDRFYTADNLNHDVYKLFF